jgi:hypothetical protein
MRALLFPFNIGEKLRYRRDGGWVTQEEHTV